MMFSRRIALVVVAGLVAGASAAQADQGISTAGVLGQLHSGNVREMRMGTMAIQHGKSKAVQDLGYTLIADHNAADTLVVQLAKAKGVTLAANTPPVGLMDLPMGDAFDASFAKLMLKEHKKTIAQMKTARAETRDTKLQVLLDQLLPVFETHAAMAQQLVDQSPKS